MEAIVFDWDGTLVDTLGGIYTANVAVMDALGLPFDEERYRRHYSPDWRVMYGRLGVPEDRLDEASALWRSVFGGGSPEPFAGVRDALARLRAAGLALGLVTAGDRDLVLPQLASTGLGEYLPVRVFGDDLPVHKPDPAPLRRALERLGVGPDRDAVAYVGDAPDDMRMASRVGVRAVGISSVLGDPDDLRAAGADELDSSVSAWVERLLAGGEPVVP